MNLKLLAGSFSIAALLAIVLLSGFASATGHIVVDATVSDWNWHNTAKVDLTYNEYTFVVDTSVSTAEAHCGIIFPGSVTETNHQHQVTQYNGFAHEESNMSYGTPWSCYSEAWSYPQYAATHREAYTY